MKTDLKRLRPYEVRIVFPPSSTVHKKPIEGYRVIIPNFEEYEFFVHRDHKQHDGTWHISCAPLGFALPDIVFATTREGTIKNATTLLIRKGKSEFERVYTQAKKIAEEGHI